ncbi:unnamed protein product [Clavelina lepadiformis]|uniref:Uncharacterized protein n=1 Tax=Clavelina lepadiformis TaxID=159417 RepID=A0ABP0H6G8_CLALP
MDTKAYLAISLFVLATSWTDAQLDASGSIYQGCNQTILEGQGMIVSPNFPAAYDRDSSCQWKVTVENDKTIILAFRHFDIENSPNCAYDSVSVYNGPTTSHPLVGKFCGPFKPSNVMTTSNRMLVTLDTDDASEKTGFLAIFTSVAPQIADPNSCGGLITDDDGTFHSVNYPKSNYPNSLTCIWHLRTSPSRIISLSFERFKIESSTNCKYDAVTVFGGWSDSDDTSFLGKFCDISQIPSEIVTEGNEMFVTFASDSSGNDMGFQARYSTRQAPVKTEENVAIEKPDSVETLSPTCSETTTLTADTGVISSPDYKRSSGYEANLRCTWRIETPSDTRIRLRFENFALERDDDCIFDYVTVYSGRDSGGELLGRYCGDAAVDELQSSSNEMYLVFVTDSGGNAAGFRATYDTLHPTTTTLAPTTTPIASSTTIAESRGSVCPEVCGQDVLLPTAVCNVNYVGVFKVLAVRTSIKSGTRIRIAVYKVFKNANNRGGPTKKGTKLWLEIPPCPQCFPEFTKRTKYVVLGSGLTDELDPNDHFAQFQKRRHRFLKKAVRRCGRAKRRGSKHKRRRRRRKSPKKVA